MAKETVTEEKDIEEAESRVYEIGYQITPMVAEENLAGLVGGFKETIESNGGKLISEDFPKLRPLAYTIRKQIAGKYQKFNSAYFGWIKFESSVEGSQKVEKAFSKDENIIRALLISTVRENTLVPQKAFAPRETRIQGKGVGVSKDKAEKTPISEEEIDKTIEELVVE